MTSLSSRLAQGVSGSCFASLAGSRIGQHQETRRSLSGLHYGSNIAKLLVQSTIVAQHSTFGDGGLLSAFLASRSVLGKKQCNIQREVRESHRLDAGLYWLPQRKKLHGGRSSSQPSAWPCNGSLSCQILQRQQEQVGLCRANSSQPFLPRHQSRHILLVIHSRSS